MTAIVGVLNKHAVAIAADSAITTSGPSGRKVLNRGNKIFMLSKYHPVGIMIYNSASFMGVPWDIIIKLYRKKLGNTSFPHLSDYKDDFIQFLKGANFFSGADTHLSYLYLCAYHLIIEDIGNEAGRLSGGITDATKDDVLKRMKVLIDGYINVFNKYKPLSSFSSYDIDKFRIYAKDVFDKLLKSMSYLNPDNDFRDKCEQLIFNFIRAEHPYISFTGLIFAGFGEDEIYPALCPVNISFVIDGILRYYDDKHNEVHISEDEHSAIAPFAQTDVMNTILGGIDPELENIYITNFKSSIIKYGSIIASRIESTNRPLADAIRSLDISPLVEEYKDSINKIRRDNYIIPLVRAISSLEKEDLIDVAESLISLTSLKRRMTFAEESVGGPVDVAVISKGDGFIWIKRKHYFDPKLNNHFFENYYK